MASVYWLYYLFAIPFLILTANTFPKWFLHIPNYESLTKSTGQITMTRKSSRWGHEMILRSEGKKISLRCHLNYIDSLYCPPYDIQREASFYNDKRVTVLWDAKHHLLYEMKIDGEKVMSYENQKSSYLSQRGEDAPILILLSTFLVSLGFIGQRAHNSK